MTRAAGYFAGRVSSALLWLGCAATFLMMVHVCLDVLGKLLFGRPLPGTLETVQFYYMVAATFLPLGHIQRRRGQIIVELFTHKVPARGIAAIDGLVGLATLVFIGLLLWFSTQTAIEMTESGERFNATQFNLETWPGRWFLVVGFAGLGLHLVLQIINDLRFAISGRKVVDTATAPVELQA